MLNVRTTISVPVWMLDELKIRALDRRSSTSREIVETLKRGLETDEKLVEVKIKEAHAFFDEIARSGIQDIDLVKALREERDRDNA